MLQPPEIAVDEKNISIENRKQLVLYAKGIRNLLQTSIYAMYLMPSWASLLADSPLFSIALPFIIGLISLAAIAFALNDLKNAKDELSKIRAKRLLLVFAAIAIVSSLVAVVATLSTIVTYALAAFSTLVSITKSIAYIVFAKKPENDKVKEHYERAIALHRQSILNNIGSLIATSAVVLALFAPYFAPGLVVVFVAVSLTIAAIKTFTAFANPKNREKIKKAFRKMRNRENDIEDSLTKNAVNHAKQQEESVLDPREKIIAPSEQRVESMEDTMEEALMQSSQASQSSHQWKKPAETINMKSALEAHRGHQDVEAKLSVDVIEQHVIQTNSYKAALNKMKGTFFSSSTPGEDELGPRPSLSHD